ncbi:helix-turn-helix domain-containing protein [Faecalibacter rhinopitheci]|uniref:XRE family transcriptional regulator n=1 Tax=Faecalibacter rhinopitheci TaxID=2779678 RepID=A0A8J7FPD6_9FLAO|nr:XRE family transcriptional regulator [Faecalibacter rhinopitheci]MBF0596904.1 XRE family transcriptional regulator [Faecalibacter rhinopitheci]
MENVINTERVKLARESRGLSQSALSKKMKTASQVLLSKIEKGISNLTPEVLDELSQVLNYPKSFFYKNDELVPLKHFYFRKNLGTSQTKLKSLEAEINIINSNINELLDSIEIQNSIPYSNLEEFKNSPKILASRIKEFLNLPRGPIKDIVNLVEKLGIIIVYHNFNTDIKIDGVSLIGNNGVPIMIINKKIPDSRKSFTIAHELGHIIMHFKYGIITEDRDVEKEANEFASNLLMPNEDIKGDLFNLNSEKLFDLKRYWKVSAQAILYKSKDLGVLTPDQHRRWVTKFNYNGWRVKEPNEFNLTEPKLTQELIRIHLEELEYTKNDISELFGLSETELDQYYFNNYSSIKHYSSFKNNVIKLKLSV